METKDIIKIINSYFKAGENADQYICGCCTAKLPYAHGQAERHRKDLNQIFENKKVEG